MRVQLRIELNYEHSSLMLSESRNAFVLECVFAQLYRGYKIRAGMRQIKLRRDSRQAKTETTVIPAEQSGMRLGRVGASALLCALPLLLSVAAAPQHHTAPNTTHESVPRQSSQPAANYPGNPGNRTASEYRGEAQRQNHLGDWLQKHQNMNPADQQNALRREPGFSRLSPDTQQRLVERLQKLNSLPPVQRQRTLSRMEAMERLSPPQRDEVRRSAQQLGALPPDRQRMVRKAFRDLRDIPGDQRSPVLNSPGFQNQFSPGERNILGTLLKVEPYQGGVLGGDSGPAKH